MLLYHVIILLVITAEHFSETTGYCDALTKKCDAYENENQKFLFYDVNPPEGFNLRRDVYMRFAIMLAESIKLGKKTNWKLVLPPWHKLYHWKSESYNSVPKPWNLFFDIEALKKYTPVTEFYELFDPKSIKETFQIDSLYILQNFPDPFEGGTFVEKWKINKGETCIYDGHFWGYNNVTAKEVICVQFQGKISKLLEILELHKNDKKVMFHHGEIPLHVSYGTKSYWDCRKSMKFNEVLMKIAKDYILKHFKCDENKCSSYLSVHWRRQDFARARKKDVPSIGGTVKQINEVVKKKTPQISKIFIATDASTSELNQLEKELKLLNYEVYHYLPSKNGIDKYKDGGIAVIDQIICSHAAYFIGTHESTFTFRIQEEREIIGFESSTTFNRLCPDNGFCEKVSKWTIVH